MTRRFVEAWNAGVPRGLLAARFGLSPPGCAALAQRLRARGEPLRIRGSAHFVAVLLLALALPALAWGHPGRLDVQGCHTVRKPGGFVYKSGKVAPQGEVHCHRALVGQPIVLDGREVLGDRGDEAREEDTRDERRGPEAR